MSILGKKWLIKNSDKVLSHIDKLRQNRGLFNIEEEKVFHDPFLFTDMRKAVDRINKAILENERIIVFGDYDVDGITGTAILIHILKRLEANVSYRIPNRSDDGYGLSEKFIDEFIEKDVKLIISVDCGISCFNEIKKAKENGIDTIITDHHTVPKKIPTALSIIHPRIDNKYPFDGLTGSGVAFKLAHGLIKEHFPEQEEELLDTLTDLASLGTVADLGPLKGENRLIVKKGLKSLQNTNWVGLKEIMNIALVKNDDKVDTITIGFRIAPRINAAGRIGDPYTALQLLLQEEQNPKVQALGRKLEELNNERQEMTKTSLDQVRAHFQNFSELPKIFIAESPDWHVGILGLVAGRLVEKHGRPAIIMQDFGDMLVASVRSPEYFNVIEALTACSEHLTGFGGHAQAAGFNIEKSKLPAFKRDINKFVESKLKNTDQKPVLEIDCHLKKNEISFDFLEEIEKLEPFGAANSQPTFLLSELEPLYISQVGKEGNHLKFSISVGGGDLKVIAFNMGEYADDLRRHRKVDLVFTLERNRWKSKDYLQLRALDFRPSTR